MKPLRLFLDPALLPKQLEDGRLQCRRCDRSWYPLLNGAMEPMPGELFCSCLKGDRP